MIRAFICFVSVLTALGALGFGVPARAAAVDPRHSVLSYADALAAQGSRLPPLERRDLARRILLLASYYQLDPRLLMALISIESSWHPHAISPVGARGLGQLMPGTARSLDVDPLEPYENLDGTARYLRRMIDRAPGSDLRARFRLALAGYNAGPAAVIRYGGIPPFAETQAYVRNVMAVYDGFCRALPPVNAAALVTVEAPPAPSHATPIDVFVVDLRRHPHLALIAPPPFPAPSESLVAYPAPHRSHGLFAFLHLHRKRADPTPAPTPALTPAPLALLTPARIAAGEPVVVEILNAGYAPVTVIETVGGNVIDRRPSGYGRRVVLKPLGRAGSSRTVVIKAFAPGNIMAKATIIADP